MFIRRCRLFWAGCMSINSTVLAGNGRFLYRQRAKTGCDPESINQFYVRNNNQDMVPLSSIVTIKKIFGTEYTNRFNLYRAAQITGVRSAGL